MQMRCKIGLFSPKITTDAKLLVPFWLSVLFCRQFCNPIAHRAEGGLKSVVGNLFVCLGSFSRSLSFATKFNVKAIYIASAVVVCENRH